MAEPREYVVRRRVVGVASIIVTASSPEEAARLAADGEWDEASVDEWEAMPEGGCRGNICLAGGFAESDPEET